jgi:hypothetical protein
MSPGRENILALPGLQEVNFERNSPVSTSDIGIRSSSSNSSNCIISSARGGGEEETENIINNGAITTASLMESSPYVIDTSKSLSICSVSSSTEITNSTIATTSSISNADKMMKDPKASEAMYAAAEEDSLAKLNEAVEAGADIDVVDKEGITPLCVAALGLIVFTQVIQE